MSKKRQAQNSTIAKYPGFWARLCDVLGTAKTGEIATLLNVSPSLVSDWKAERASPTLSVLFDIAEIGGTEIDWLLTGKRPKTIEVGLGDSRPVPLPSDTRRTIGWIAKVEGLSPDRVVEQLVHDGLMFRGEPFVWHEDEDIRKGESQIIVKSLKWMRGLAPDEQLRFAKRMSFLLLNAIAQRNEQPGEIGPMTRADMIWARSIGKVDGGEEEEKIRKTG